MFKTPYQALERLLELGALAGAVVGDAGDVASGGGGEDVGFVEEHDAEAYAGSLTVETRAGGDSDGAIPAPVGQRTKRARWWTLCGRALARE